jgi:Flp pilus assembly protein TadG
MNIATNSAQCRSPRRQRGLAAVEFAIVAPVLLLLMLAVAEFGRALYQYNTLSKAVRDSARYYSTHAFVGTTTVEDPAAKTYATNLVTYGNGSGAGEPLLPSGSPLTAAATTATGADGTFVTVTATYTFTFLPGNPLAGLLGLFGSTLADSLALTSTVTMRAI